MEACILIATWMGHDLEIPIVRCFQDDATRLAYVRLINVGSRGENEWLGGFYTRREIVESGRLVRFWEDDS